MDVINDYNMNEHSTEKLWVLKKKKISEQL